MAGRGRQSTLPAWMTSGASAGSIPSYPPPTETNQFDDYHGIGGAVNSGGMEYPIRSEPERLYSDVRDAERYSGSGRGGDADRSRDGDRSRDRDGEEWRPRKNRASNFDVRPADGIELPGVGSGGLSTGVGLGGPPVMLSSGTNGHGGSGHGSTGTTGGSRYGATHGNSASEAARQHQTRHARRLYVGGIPPGTRDEDLMVFFRDVINKTTAPHPVPPSSVMQVYINAEKCFAFVELDSMELTLSCLDLDGIKYDPGFGNPSTLRIRRPNDFKPELMPSTVRKIPHFNPGAVGVIPGAAGGGGSGSGDSSASSLRLFIGGLPYTLTDDQVKELLSAFGQIKSFNLVRDPGSVTSKGYAFCEYADPTGAAAQMAITGLHNLQIGEKTLTVRPATSATSTGTSTGTTAGMGMGMNAGYSQAALQSSGYQAGGASLSRGYPAASQGGDIYGGAGASASYGGSSYGYGGPGGASAGSAGAGSGASSSAGPVTAETLLALQQWQQRQQSQSQGPPGGSWGSGGGGGGDYY